MNKTKINRDAQKETAYDLFMAGRMQIEIAERIGVSRQTVGKWVSEGGWQERKSAKMLSRKEIVRMMLQQLHDKITSGDWQADEIAKITSSIEKLDKQTNIVTIIEVFTAHSQWLITRLQVEKQLPPEEQVLTPELVRIINKYQDMFIGEKLGKIDLPELELFEQREQSLTCQSYAESRKETNKH